MGICLPQYQSPLLVKHRIPRNSREDFWAYLDVRTCNTFFFVSLSHATENEPSFSIHSKKFSQIVTLLNPTSYVYTYEGIHRNWTLRLSRCTVNMGMKFPVLWSGNTHSVLGAPVNSTCYIKRLRNAP